jgi:hypothetical protein
MIKMLSFRRKASHRKLEGKTDHESYSSIHAQWQESCEANNLVLPKKASNEFKKRLKLCKNGRVQQQKAKLNLSKCGLDDLMVALLVQALSVKSVIAKLDLSGNNIQNNAAVVLVQLLIAQAKEVRETSPNDRLEAIYLGELLLDNNKTFIKEAVLADIQTVAAALYHVNIKTLISKMSSQEASLNKQAVNLIRKQVIGKIKGKQTFFDSLILSEEAVGDDALVTYSSLEDMLIDELIALKVIPDLTRK